MPWNLDNAQAQWVLGTLPSEHTPEVAWDALEQGFDGPALRRLAALDRPTYFEVTAVFPEAMQETEESRLAKRKLMFDSREITHALPFLV